MKLFDFFRSRRKKKKTGPMSEPVELEDLSSVDPAELDPPETRFTREYEEFLNTLEAEERSGEAAGETEAEAETGKAEPGEETP